MKRFASDYGLRKMKDVKIDFYDLGLTEIVVMPTSNFAGLRIGEANLRKRFGINVLGVKRGYIALMLGLFLAVLFQTAYAKKEDKGFAMAPYLALGCLLAMLPA